MKTLNPPQLKVCAMILLLLCSGNNLLAQSEDNQAPGKKTRSNVLYHPEKMSHSLPLNAIGAAALLDTSRVSRNPVKLRFPAGDRLFPSDSMFHRLGVTLKAESSSGNWTRIFRSIPLINQN
ncbi:MAG: hypothetical protein JNL40_06340 [Cyclobacteriaceae bacterium]|nr:hypothetical protein [Cyclobacteriaceae bacterium]